MRVEKKLDSGFLVRENQDIFLMYSMQDAREEEESKMTSGIWK